MKILNLILILFIFISCKEIKTSENVAIILDQTNNKTFIYNHLEIWTPNQLEIDLAERIILKVINDHKTQYNVKEIFANINDYRHQIVPVIYKDNRRVIFVNSLCKSFVENPLPSLYPNKEKKKEIAWKEFVYNVHDGGNCFWNVMIDIDKKEYFDFRVNGF
jgi:hypothetical protein